MSAKEPFLRVDQYELFGELVDEWVRNPGKRPRDWKTFEDQLTAKGIKPIVAADFGKPDPYFHELIDGKLNITLPSVKMLDAAKTAIALQDGGYEFPSQYNKAYPELPKSTIRPEVRESIQKARLADYCISLCM